MTKNLNNQLLLEPRKIYTTKLVWHLDPDSSVQYSKLLNYIYVGFYWALVYRLKYM